MPTQVRYDQTILAGQFVKEISPISARASVAMQQEQWLALTCINVVHLHVVKCHGLSWRECCSHGVFLCFEVSLRAVLCFFAVIIISPFEKSVTSQRASFEAFGLHRDKRVETRRHSGGKTAKVDDLNIPIDCGTHGTESTKSERKCHFFDI